MGSSYLESLLKDLDSDTEEDEADDEKIAEQILQVDNNTQKDPVQSSQEANHHPYPIADSRESEQNLNEIADLGQESEFKSKEATYEEKFNIDDLTRKGQYNENSESLSPSNQESGSVLSSPSSAEIDPPLQDLDFEIHDSALDNLDFDVTPEAEFQLPMSGQSQIEENAFNSHPIEYLQSHTPISDDQQLKNLSLLKESQGILEKDIQSNSKQKEVQEDESVKRLKSVFDSSQADYSTQGTEFEPAPDSNQLSDLEIKRGEDGFTEEIAEREPQNIRSLLSSHALEEAEKIERSQGGPQLESSFSESGPIDPIVLLQSKLQPVRDAWNASEHSGKGGMYIGKEICYMAEPISSFNRVIENHKDTNNMTCIASQGEKMAIGMNSGSTLVADIKAQNPNPSLKPQPTLIAQLHLRSSQSSISALAFNFQAHLLVVGHENGDVNLWERKQTAWENVKSLRDAHTSTITQVAFIEGLQIQAVSMENNGRIVCHNVSSYLSLAAKLAGKLSKLMQPTLLNFTQPFEGIRFLSGLQPAGDCKIIQEGVEREGPNLGSLIKQVCDGIILALSDTKICIGRIGNEGRFLEICDINLDTQNRQNQVCVDWQLIQIEPSSRTAFAHLIVAQGDKILKYQINLPLSVGNQMSSDYQLLTRHTIPQGLISMHLTPSRHCILLFNIGNILKLNMHLPDLQDEIDMDMTLRGLPRSKNEDSRPNLNYTHSCSKWIKGLVLLSTNGVWAVKALKGKDKISLVLKAENFEMAILLGLQDLQRSLLAGSDLTEAKSQLLTILTAYIQQIMVPEPSILSTKKNEQDMAQLCVDLCLAIDTKDFLWESVYPNFESTQKQALFFEALLPSLLKGQISSMPPSTMKDFVDYYESVGRLEVVEAAVMRIGPASMDFNQIFRICRQHRLYSALIHIYSKGFNEFIAPAVELLIALTIYPSEAQNIGYKLLIYIRESLRGNNFPPGTGKMDSKFQAAEKLLALMLHGSLESILKTLQDWPFTLSEQQKKELEKSFSTPHPVLVTLLELDTGGTLNMLLEYFGSHYTLVGDLLGSVSRSSHNTVSDESAEQAFLDTILSLLHEESFGRRLSNPESSSDQILLYVLLSVTEGRVTTNSKTIFRLLEWTCLTSESKHAEKQFIDLLAHLDLSHGDHPIRVQEMARKAQFIKAEARILHLSGKPTIALQKLMEISSKSAFEYLEEEITSPQSSIEAKSQLKQAALDLMGEFVEANSRKYARFALRIFPEQFWPGLSNLKTKDLQFRFLDAAILVLTEDSLEATNVGEVLEDLARKTGGSEMEVNEAYLKLLCQFRPDDVLKSLDSLTSYRVQEILPVCQACKIPEAEAFLYERLGNVSSALQIYIDHALEAVQSLLRFVQRASISETRLQDIMNDRIPHSQLISRHSREAEDQSLAHYVGEARKKVQAATFLCRRNSQDVTSQDVKTLWLHLLHSFLSLTEVSLSPNLSTGPEENSERKAKTIGWEKMSSQQVVMRILEDITTDMAVSIPLALIGNWILQEFSSAQFAYFRSSLLGLLAAHSYEHNILQAASRLMSSDALRCLQTSYMQNQKGNAPN